MKRWEESITIKAPADKVFSYVSDFARHGEWSGHGLQVSRADDGPVVVGTKWSERALRTPLSRLRTNLCR